MGTLLSLVGAILVWFGPQWLALFHRNVDLIIRTQIALELNDDIAYKNKNIAAADGKSHLSLYLQAGLFF